MEFHDFPTIYGVLKHNGLFNETADRYYGATLALLTGDAGRHPSHAVAVEYNRTTCEWDWLRGGSPYFKAYPAMIPLLSSVGIELPVDYLRLPFQAFAIRLPTEETPLAIDDQYHVRAILVCDGQPVDTQERRVYLWIDVGERGVGDAPVLRTASPLPPAGGLGLFPGDGRRPPDGTRRPEQGPDGLHRSPKAGRPPEGAANCGEGGAAGEEGLARRPARAISALAGPAARGHEGGESRGSLHFQHQRRAQFRLLPSQKVTFVRQATVPQTCRRQRHRGSGIGWNRGKLGRSKWPTWADQYMADSSLRTRHTWKHESIPSFREFPPGGLFVGRSGRSRG